MATVQSGSITRASLQHNVAQPALSLHIRNMEADLGVPLLFRTTQGVQPTEAGHPHAQRSAPPRPVREDAGRGGSAEPCGVVRIGLPSSIAHILGVPLVLAARERHPKINLRIAEAMSGYVLDWLRLGRVDLVRTAGRARACPRRARDPALADRALILPSPGHGLRDFLEAKAAKAGVCLAPAFEIDAYGSIKALVAKGLGLSVLPAHAKRQGGLRTRLAHLRFRPAADPQRASRAAGGQRWRTSSAPASGAQPGCTTSS